MLYVYNLTPLTRNANKDRRVIIQGFDIARRGLILFVAGIFVTSPLAVAAYTLIGSYGVFVHAILLVAWFWLIEGRTRGGLRLRRYQAILDKQFDATTNTFIRCWIPMKDPGNAWCWLRSATAPNPRLAQNTEI